jgi:DNA (cytosine-5)-methyltransferase 1
MRLLDLFCCAGGAAMGYYRAGFEVVGVDIEPQPRYPFEFHQADALEYLAVHGHEFDVIHASPPCQAYSAMKEFTTREYPKLIAPIRELLIASGKPYVIENVEGAKKEMINPLTLCGTMFGLRVIRHRLFETRPEIYFTPHPCNHWLRVVKQGRWPIDDKQFACITGSFSNQPYARRAMGIDWMKREELAEAIPPAYTEFVGRQLLSQMETL